MFCRVESGDWPVDTARFDNVPKTQLTQFSFELVYAVLTMGHLYHHSA